MEWEYDISTQSIFGSEESRYQSQSAASFYSTKHNMNLLDTDT